MRGISPQTRAILEEDERMGNCPLRGLFGGCNGRIEWHHNLIVGGRQSDYPKHIIGVCHAHHDMVRNKEVKEMIDFAMLRMLSKEEIDDISKAINYHQRLKYLEEKYA